MFGVSEELRRTVLGMLGARDLATFGLTSRAAAASAVADPLWASLVAAEFSEREQHAYLFLQTSSTDDTDTAPPSTLRETSGGGVGDVGGGVDGGLAGADADPNPGRFMA
ncbi:unnamed protein product, partial [Laminaria digitata]